MKSQYELVKDFHAKYNLPKNKQNAKLQQARIGHLEEELQEYKTAVETGDVEMQLDALVDLVYVALGSAYYENFDFDGAFAEVHTANMKKIQQSTERSEWDVVKPAGWTAPDLKKYI
jgi:predicted HAD superfamily Cof-like phosphohydrolase